MSESAEGPLTTSLELLTRVASMYYLEEMTQEKIASELGISRPKVWRLLVQAKESRIVEITVNLHPALAMPLEAELVARFELSQAVVVEDQPDDELQRSRIGLAAIRLLDQLVHERTVVSVGMGRNVKAVSQQPVQLRPRQILVVSAIGGSAEVAGGVNSNDIASRLAELFHAPSEGIYAPAYAGNSDIRNDFLDFGAARRTLDHARSADIAIVGIGDANAGSLVVQLGCLSPNEMVRVRNEGGVGDILGSFFDSSGDPVARWIEERVVALTRQDLRRIPNVIAVCAELSKVHAIRAALLSGIVDTLVTSSSVARRVIELDKAANPQASRSGDLDT